MQRAENAQSNAGDAGPGFNFGGLQSTGFTSDVYVTQQSSEQAYRLRAHTRLAGK